MGMDQQLYARYYVKNKTRSKGDKEGCPVDIPLSADPYCGIRHFEDVTYIMKEVMYWRRNEAIHDFFRYHTDGGIPNNCEADIYISRSTIMDLRDELMKLANGKKSELSENFDCYVDDDGKIDKEWAKRDAEMLNFYLHTDDHVEFVYSYSY